jgi:hypothetical protein
MSESKWVRVDERLPKQEESPSGYFWSWDETEPDDAPFLVEAWERDGVPMGFCSEGCVVIVGITHWQPVIFPEAPEL